MTDVLLVNAFQLAQDPVEQRLMEPYFPLGILYIAATLRAAGYDVALFDNCFEQDEQACLAEIARLQPTVVGINALNTTRRLAMRVGRWARAQGYPVVFGGPDPTVRPEAYVLPDGDLPPAADVCVIGEGEATVIEVIAALTGKAPRPRVQETSLRAVPVAAARVQGTRNREQGGGAVLTLVPPSAFLGEEREGWAAIPGIVFATPDGDVITTAQRASLSTEQLDALPFPAWDLVNVEQYRQAWTQKHGRFSMSLITSRGCPFGCNWCAKPVFGRTYRLRSPANVVAEMKWIKEQFGPDLIRIVDDIFGLNPRWLDKWHAQVLAENAVIPFECLSRTDLVKVANLSKLKDAGCRKIFFGAESGSQEVLDAMNKGIDVEDTQKATKAMRAVGLAMHFYIMVGYPGEDPADIQRTAALLRECAPESMSVSVAYPLPGTGFYDKVKELLLPKHDWAYSSENVLLFRRDKYSSLFYKWVERLLNKEWQVARWQYTGKPSPYRQARLLAERAVCRTAVAVLGCIQDKSLPFGVAGSSG